MVLDTETSGIKTNKKDCDDPYILQLSYIIIENFKILKKVDKFVKLKNNVITKEAYDIHNISFEMCKNKGVPVKDLILDLMIDIEDIDLFVGHNFKFDYDMLRIETKRLVNSIDADFPMKFLLVTNLNDIINISNEKIYCTMKEGKPLCKLTYKNKKDQLIPKKPKLSELYQYLFNKNPKNMHNSFNDIVATLRCFYKMYDGIDICEYNDEMFQLIKSIEEDNK
jgi:DNA polymerase III epsilon subunit-like protein